MNKETYLQELRKALKVLPQEDRDEAVEFYEEYFDDAGFENESKVIEELGDPKVLGKKILIDIVDRQYGPAEEENNNQTGALVAADQIINSQATPNTQENAAPNFQQPVAAPVQTEKKKPSALKGLGIVLAAIFALPLSPVIFALLIVVCVLIFVAFITLAAFTASGVACIAAGIVTFILGIIALFGHPAPALTALGSGLASFGIGSFMVIGSVALIRLLAIGLSSLFGKIVHKKNKKQKQQASR
ncbi:MAG: DUF1700 domain-containing protein [Clostridiales bacterium]|nr:DUF1700 domain-containing protein [Clostridiales bacterium]